MVGMIGDEKPNILVVFCCKLKLIELSYILVFIWICGVASSSITLTIIISYNIIGKHVVILYITSTKARARHGSLF